MSENIHMYIDYDESEPPYEYHAVKLVFGVDTYVFSTGDPVVDFKSAEEKASTLGPKFMIFSSSITHFVMDNEDYFMAWDPETNREWLEKREDIS